MIDHTNISSARKDQQKTTFRRLFEIGSDGVPVPCSDVNEDGTRRMPDGERYLTLRQVVKRAAMSQNALIRAHAIFAAHEASTQSIRKDVFWATVWARLAPALAPGAIIDGEMVREIVQAADAMERCGVELAAGDRAAVERLRRQACICQDLSARSLFIIPTVATIGGER